MRLRQVALVAKDLASTTRRLETLLGIDYGYADPGVIEFGLANWVAAIGDTFLEVVSPVDEGTTAGRLLDKRSGDGGYMAIYEVDDLDRRVEYLTANDVRIVWSGDLPAIRGRHLHPRDVGGALVSIDQPVPNGSWTWGGPDWTAHQDTSVVSGIAGVTVAAADPAAMRSRWHQLEIDSAVRFVEASSRGEGIDGVDLVATERSRAGESHTICGTTFKFV